MGNRTKHVLKAIASGFLPGLGQLFNKQFLKALFFFVFFAAFISIELTSGKYFSEFDPYDNLTEETGELFTDDFSKSFYQMYQFQKSLGEVDLPEFEAYYESVKSNGFTMRELIDYTAEDILKSSTPRYFLLIDDLVISGTKASTSDTGEINDSDLIIGEDDAAIEAKGFLPIITGVSIYEMNDKEYYRIITGEGDTREITYINVNDPSDIIDDVTGFTVSTRTGQLYLEQSSGKIYVRSTQQLSVLETVEYRYTNVADSTDYYVTADSLTTIATFKSLVIKGSVVYDNEGTIYVKYLPELAYEMVHGYNKTPFSEYLRNYITKRYNVSTSSYNSTNYNRFLIEVYFSMHPELRAEFETEFYNFYNDRAGFFVKGIWAILTLGTREKVTYNYKSLHDPLKSVTFTEDGIQYAGVSGILDETPLLGHVSSYLLILGLISTLLMAYFIFAWIWSVRDAYATSIKYAITKTHVSDKEWFIEVYSHGFEYIMILPALFVITFISIMPILFGFLIAFSSYSGFDSDTGLFSWVGFYNFTRIFNFGEGIPFAETFWKVFVWTAIWAVFSTATVFFGGMFQALVISSDRVPFKKFWRTLLILPWAVPALISQMAFSIIFSEKGIINSILKNIGFGKTFYEVFTDWGILGVGYNPETMNFFQRIFYLGYDDIQWFTNANNIWFVRIILIVVNIWLGAPYFMALMTSIMTSIDRTLYEAADIDGATKSQKFRFITFPLIMYSTAPLLVMAFSGNFNNFGVIYFITQGGTGAGDIDTAFAGSTDILISWMYTLTVEKKVYNMASVFSIFIFLIVGSVAAWNYSQTKAFKED